MPHAYTEDQLVEQPAIGLFAEQSASPNPQPGPSATLPPRGEGPRDEGAQLALPPEAFTAAISGIGPVSTVGEKVYFSEIPVQMTGQEGGHKTRQEYDVFSSSALFSVRKTENEPDIYAEIRADTFLDFRPLRLG